MPTSHSGPGLRRIAAYAVLPVAILCLWCSRAVAGLSADTGCFVIGEIHTKGNKHTRSNQIIRELDLHPGDTLCLPGDSVMLHRNEQRVFNTQLFNKVTIQISGDSADAVRDLTVVVDERWYIFPRPIFELADRNFNEWWRQRGRDLRRVDIGASVSHRNLTGNKDKLKIKVHGGFTNKYELSYVTPYLGPAQNDRMTFSFSYSTNKEVAYRTLNDKLDFLKLDELARTRFYAKAGYAKRMGFFTTAFAELEYQHNTINDTLAKLNPDYFLDGKALQQFLGINLDLIYDNRDVRAYAHRGNLFKIGIINRGLLYNNGFEMTDVNASLAKYIPLGGPFYYAGSINGSVYGPHRVPYNFSNALGIGQYFVRGYDLYVIDGPGTAFTRNTARLKIFSKDFNIEKIIPLRQFSNLPLALYFNVFGDAGYVEEGTFNRLNPRLKNKLLAGWGAGLDLVTFYDLVWRFEYSFNREGEASFFFHLETDI